MDDSRIHFIASVFKSNKKYRRFLWLVSVFAFTILLAFIALLVYLERTDSDIRIDFSKSGATLVINGEEPIAAQFLLHSSARWTNTGIKLKGGTKIEVTASGIVHLASHRLVDAAVTDRRPPFTWSTPRGIDFVNKRAGDVYRRNFLINPNAPMGVIIAYFQKDGDPEPGMQNPRPENLVTIYEHTEIVVPDYPVTLWLIVNDIILDPKRIEDSKKAYFGPLEELTLKEKAVKDSSWDYIVSEDYWDIWYDDNFGSYLIQLKNVSE